MDTTKLKRHIVVVLIADHLWKYQALSIDSMLTVFIVLFPKFRGTYSKPHLCSVLMQWHGCHMDNHSNSSHNRGRGNHSWDEFGKRLGHTDLPKPVPKDWKLICPRKSNACWSIQISKWWTHVWIFSYALSEKNVLWKLWWPKQKPKTKTKTNHLNYINIVKIKLDVEA